MIKDDSTTHHPPLTMPDDDLLDDLEDEAGDALAPPSLAVGRSVELTVQPKTSALRLDQYLVVQFADHSRSLLRRAIDAGAVTVNGKPAKASTKTRVGDRVAIQLPEPERPDPA